jgi:hypothetical protein
VEVRAPVDQVAALSVEEYFQKLCDMMIDNPAATYDSDMVRRIAKVGISPGGTFNLSGFSGSKQKAIKTGYSNGQLKLENFENTINRRFKNGWTYLLDDIGTFKDQYDLRAYIANVGFGANLPEDGVYPITSLDQESAPLNNSFAYTITFPAGQAPPQQGFWSITMYNSSHFLTQNLINRYAIGSYSNYQLNNDNSLTLYIQKDSPGIEKESNWLPTPQGDNSAFYLMMRIYWPDQIVLDNMWEIPGVVKVN